MEFGLRSQLARRMAGRTLSVALAVTFAILACFAPAFIIGSGAMGSQASWAPPRGVESSMPVVRPDVAASAQSASSSGVVAASMAAACVAVAAKLARSFSKAVPRREAEPRSQATVAACGAAGVQCSSSVSSSSSSFLGSSMAGSITAAMPTRPGGSAMSSMSMMFERFNEKSIKAVMKAQEESRRLGHNYVGSEMLLVGVASENSGIVAKVMKELNVATKDVRKTVEEILGRGDGQVATEIPFTPAAKRVLASSVKEAQKLSSSTVDPAHILLSLLTDEGGEASKVFEKLGVEKKTLLDVIGKEFVDKAVEEKAVEASSPNAGKRKGPTSALEEFGKDLTAMAERGEMDPLVGREEELERTIQILARRQKNNPVLIGEPGVGKTAIAEGLAYRIVSGDVPEMLLDKKIIELDLGMLLSGTKYRGEFEERLKNIVEQVREGKGQIIVMIDEIHTLVGAGGGGDGGAMDAANILKPALSRGEFQVIGATTVEEYRKYVEKDKALERRFQPVKVPEPTDEQTVEILRGLARKYEAHHKLRYSDEALVACVTLASQYIQDRYLPDKAIDVLDETGARVSLRQLAKVPDDAMHIRAELRDVQEKKDEAVSLQNYADAETLREREIELQKQVNTIIMEFQAKARAEAAESDTTETPSTEATDQSEDFSEPIVMESDVANVVSTWTGVPVEKVSSDESARLISLEDTLHDRVIGQEEATVAVAKAVRRARAGLKNPNRPIASFIFCGPTGVGKTELCKALSEAYFGSEDAMIRLDMSEYMEKHTVSKLIGSPPGYVGYDEESQLTDGVRRKPYSLVLFDECEKAHPDVFNLMLQILEDGRLTDSKGRTVSFKNTLIIMTSNCGAKAIQKALIGGGDLGFSGGMDDDDANASSYGRLKTLVQEELKGFFRPEFLNRLDEIIVFKSLTLPEVGEIAEIEFRKTFKRCRERGVTLSLTERFKTKVVNEGFNPVYGARPLRRSIMRLLEDNLAESFLNIETIEGEYIICDLDKNDAVVVLRQRLEEEVPESRGGGLAAPPNQKEVSKTVTETTTA